MGQATQLGEKTPPQFGFKAGVSETIIERHSHVIGLFNFAAFRLWELRRAWLRREVQGMAQEQGAEQGHKFLFHGWQLS